MVYFATIFSLWSKLHQVRSRFSCKSIFPISITVCFKTVQNDDPEKIICWNACNCKIFLHIPSVNNLLLKKLGTISKRATLKPTIYPDIFRRSVMFWLAFLLRTPAYPTIGIWARPVVMKEKILLTRMWSIINNIKFTRWKPLSKPNQKRTHCIEYSGNHFERWTHTFISNVND